MEKGNEQCECCKRPSNQTLCNDCTPKSKQKEIWKNKVDDQLIYINDKLK